MFFLGHILCVLVLTICIYIFVSTFPQTEEFFFSFKCKMDFFGSCIYMYFLCVCVCVAVCIMWTVYIQYVCCHLSPPEYSLFSSLSEDCLCVGEVPIRRRRLSRWQACPGQTYPKDPIHIITTSKHQPRATCTRHTHAAMHSHTHTNRVHN